MLAAVHASAQSSYCWLWHNNAGSVSDIGGKSIALYTNAVYNSGMFTTATITIDDSLFINRGATDIYLVKRDVKGDMLWAKTLGGPLNESVAKIDVDKNGGVYIGGTFSGSMQAEGVITSNGGTDIFIAKYSSQGALQWIKIIGSIGNDSLMTLVIDAEDRLRIVGSFFRNRWAWTVHFKRWIRCCFHSCISKPKRGCGICKKLRRTAFNTIHQRR